MLSHCVCNQYNLTRVGNTQCLVLTINIYEKRNYRLFNKITSLLNVGYQTQ